MNNARRLTGIGWAGAFDANLCSRAERNMSMTSNLSITSAENIRSASQALYVYGYVYAETCDQRLAEATAATLLMPPLLQNHLACRNGQASISQCCWQYCHDSRRAVPMENKGHPRRCAAAPKPPATGTSIWGGRAGAGHQRYARRLRSAGTSAICCNTTLASPVLPEALRLALMARVAALTLLGAILATTRINLPLFS